MPRSAVKRLSDSQLVALSRERDALEKRIAKLQALADKRKDKIIAELDRRGTDSITHDRYKITMVVTETPQYDQDYLREHLTRPQLRLVSKEVIDISRLSQLVQEGRIPLDVASHASHIRRSKPYIRAGAVR